MRHIIIAYYFRIIWWAIWIVGQMLKFVNITFFCIYKHTYIYENIQLTIHKFIPNVSQFHQAYRIASFWVFCKFVGNI